MIKMNYASTEYENYLNNFTNKLTTEYIRVNKLKIGSKIHYIARTIIGNNIYNAKIVDFREDDIIIHPVGWDKHKHFILKYDEDLLAKGWI